MGLQFDTTDRSAWLTTLNTAIGASATIKLFTGSAPANVAASEVGTLLATLTGNASGFGSVSSGVLTAGAVTSATAAATGTVGHFRVATSGGTVIMQGTVATSGADLNITNTSINSGDTVSVSSWTITAPGA